MNEHVDGHLREIEEQGYTIVEDALEPDLVDGLVEDLDRLEQRPRHRARHQHVRGHPDDPGLQPARPRPPFERIPVHPAILPICEGVLDRGLLVSSLSSIAIGPGETAQPVHADDQVIPLPKPHPATVCNTMWALTDFTEANGATRLVPGIPHGRPLPRPHPRLRHRSPPTCPRAACSCGTAASGTAAGPTPPPSGASASP